MDQRLEGRVMEGDGSGVGVAGSGGKNGTMNGNDFAMVNR
jgi:hypothetical protein